MSAFFPTYPHNKHPQMGTLATQPRGMNFAQTARAEELKAARARKAAHDDHEQLQLQQQQREQGLGLPNRGPIPLGAYTVFKKRTRTKHGKVQRGERGRNDSQEELSRPTSTVPSIQEESENDGAGNVQTEQMGSAHKKRESMARGYERYLREQANKAAGSSSGFGRMPNEASTTTINTTTTSTNPNPNPTTTSGFQFSPRQTIPNVNAASSAHVNNAGLNSQHHVGDFGWRDEMSRHPTLVASYSRNNDNDFARLTPSSHQSSRISSLLTRGGPRYPATGGNEYSTFPPPGPTTPTEGSVSEDDDPFGYDGGQGVPLNVAHTTNTNAPSGKENGHAYSGKDLYWDHSNMNRTITQRDYAPHQNIHHPPSMPPSGVPRPSVRMPPAVKGTATEKSSRHPFPTFDPRKPRTAYGEVAAAARKAPMPNHENLVNPYVKSGDRLHPAMDTPGHVRDPHPYTGFTAPSNKTEMLMQSFDKLTSKEDTSNKRSVLYDPMTDSFGGRSRHASSVKPESSVSAQHAASALRRDGYLGDLDFQRDLLNKSDPLPPMPNVNELDVDSGVDGLTNSDQTRYSSSQPNQRDDVFSTYPTTSSMTSANTVYLREQQRQLQQCRQEEEYNARLNSHYNTGLALEELARRYDPMSQAERDAEVVAWFTKPYADGEYVREILFKDNASTHPAGVRHRDGLDGVNDISSPPLTARYLPTSAAGDYQSFAPPTSKPPPTTALSKTAGIDLLAPLMANLHTHQLNNFQGCPFTRYTMPPAWCVDTTGLPGSKDSFFGEGEEGGWNPPKRVGRDRRRVMRVIEGRATYFEEGVGVGVVSPGGSGV